MQNHQYGLLNYLLILDLLCCSQCQSVWVKVKDSNLPNSQKGYSRELTLDYVTSIISPSSTFTHLIPIPRANAVLHLTQQLRVTFVPAKHLDMMFYNHMHCKKYWFTQTTPYKGGWILNLQFGNVNKIYLYGHQN